MLTVHLTFRDLFVQFCFLVLFVTLGVGIWREYYRPYSSDPDGSKFRKLRLRIYFIQIILWLALTIFWASDLWRRM